MGPGGTFATPSVIGGGGGVTGQLASLFGTSAGSSGAAQGGYGGSRGGFGGSSGQTSSVNVDVSGLFKVIGSAFSWAYGAIGNLGKGYGSSKDDGYGTPPNDSPETVDENGYGTPPHDDFTDNGFSSGSDFWGGYAGDASGSDGGWNSGYSADDGWGGGDYSGGGDYAGAGDSGGVDFGQFA